MEYLEIQGPAKLRGTFALCGAKNSILPLLAASLLTDGKTVFRSVPDLSDVALACGILSVLGIKHKRRKSAVEIWGRMPEKVEMPRELMTGMRGSFIFLGALLARHGSASMYLPGGCKLGDRPVDIHLHALGTMGAQFEVLGDRVEAYVPDGRLQGADITLRLPSVGATENILMAAATAEGITIVNNAAREPEIVDLANYLNQCGAAISGAGEDVIVVRGVDKLHGADYTVVPDRILAATLFAAAGITRSRFSVKGIDRKDLKAILSVFSKAGIVFSHDGDRLTVDGTKGVRNISLVRCEPHPKFPTDAGPLLAAMLCAGTGKSEVYDTVFEARFRFSSELNKFCADTANFGRSMIIHKICRPFEGAQVTAMDLRGGAALVCMALGSEGVSKVFGLQHIDRGYAGIENVFASLGADIQRKTL